MKKIIIPALILMLGAAISAFTITSEKQPVEQNLTDPYWHFTGTTSMEESDPSKYEPIDDPDEPNCSGSGLRCVIQAPASGNPSEPDLSGPITVVYEKS